MKKNAGFTLIELLVVVLIIGVLASVALPQYQIAVAKTRISAMIPMLRSIQQAQERYYMANGSFAQDIRDLDIDCAVYGTGVHDGWCYFDSKGKASAHLENGPQYVVASDARVSGVLLIYLYRFPQHASCYAFYTNKDLATRVCRSVAGLDEPSFSVSGADVYRLW